MFAYHLQGTPMKLFVSGKVGAEAETRSVMTALRGRGHQITFDWTSIDHLRPYEENAAPSAHAAELELAGVAAADALVLLADERGVGMYVELGAALALGKPVYVVTAPPARTMFFFHPLVHIVRDTEELLRRLAESH
jgi:hypothetical protein